MVVELPAPDGLGGRCFILIMPPPSSCQHETPQIQSQAQSLSRLELYTFERVASCLHIDVGPCRLTCVMITPPSSTQHMRSHPPEASSIISKDLLPSEIVCSKAAILSADWTAIALEGWSQDFSTMEGRGALLDWEKYG